MVAGLIDSTPLDVLRWRKHRYGIGTICAGLGSKEMDMSLESIDTVVRFLKAVRARRIKCQSRIA